MASLRQRILERNQRGRDAIQARVDEKNNKRVGPLLPMSENLPSTDQQLPTQLPSTPQSPMQQSVSGLANMEQNYIDSFVNTGSFDVNRTSMLPAPGPTLSDLYTKNVGVAKAAQAGAGNQPLPETSTIGSGLEEKSIQPASQDPTISEYTPIAAGLPGSRGYTELGDPGFQKEVFQLSEREDLQPIRGLIRSSGSMEVANKIAEQYEQGYLPLEGSLTRHKGSGLITGLGGFASLETIEAVDKGRQRRIEQEFGNEADRIARFGKSNINDYEYMSRVRDKIPGIMSVKSTQRNPEEPRDRSIDYVAAGLVKNATRITDFTATTNKKMGARKEASEKVLDLFIANKIMDADGGVIMNLTIEEEEYAAKMVEAYYKQALRSRPNERADQQLAADTAYFFSMIRKSQNDPFRSEALAEDQYQRDVIDISLNRGSTAAYARVAARAEMVKALRAFENPNEAIKNAAVEYKVYSEGYIDLLTKLSERREALTKDERTDPDVLESQIGQIDKQMNEATAKLGELRNEYLVKFEELGSTAGQVKSFFDAAQAVGDADALSKAEEEAGNKTGLPDAPEATEAPEALEATGIPEAPEATEATETTEAPEITETPEETQTSSIAPLTNAETESAKGVISTFVKDAFDRKGELIQKTRMIPPSTILPGASVQKPQILPVARVKLEEEIAKELNLTTEGALDATLFIIDDYITDLEKETIVPKGRKPTKKQKALLNQLDYFRGERKRLVDIGAKPFIQSTNDTGSTPKSGLPAGGNAAQQVTEYITQQRGGQRPALNRGL